MQAMNGYKRISYALELAFDASDCAVVSCEEQANPHVGNR